MLLQEIPVSRAQPTELPAPGWLRPWLRITIEVCLLLGFAVLVRLPYFIRTVIDWDESTFILMADSLLNGHLPQTEYSAFKPPLAYVPYAAFLLMFGQSVAAVRLGGLVCVAFASVAIYLACRRRFGTSGAMLAGMFVSVLATVDRHCGCTMLEHIALVPLSLVILIWPRGALSTQRIFWVGMLIGVTAALKTNLAAFVLAPLSLIFMQLSVHGWKRTLRLVSVLMLGLGLPLVASIPVYWLSGNLDLWWHSCVLTTFSYLADNVQSVEGHVPDVIARLSSCSPAGFALAWLVPMLALMIGCKYRQKFTQESAFLITMAIFFACGMVTVFSTSVFHIRHYFVVLVPFAAAMSGFLLQLALSSRWRVVFGLPIMCLLLLSLSPVADEYKNVWRSVVEGRSTDTAYKVAEYLNSRQVNGKYVYFTRWNIGYWMTGALIPTRYIHPAHIGNSRILSTLYREPTDPMSELRSIFAKKPIFVVTDASGGRIRGDNQLKQAFASELSSSYVLETTIDTTAIFRRKSQ